MLFLIISFDFIYKWACYFYRLVEHEILRHRHHVRL